MEVERAGWGIVRAIVFKKSGCQNRGGTAEIALDYVGLQNPSATAGDAPSPYALNSLQIPILNAISATI